MFLSFRQGKADTSHSRVREASDRPCDVMNELAKRGYEGVGSDIAPSYSGIADGTAVTTMPYVQMDITDKASGEKVIKEANVDAVIHCAAWTAVDAAEDEDNQPKSIM